MTDGNLVAGKPHLVQKDGGAKRHQGLRQPGDTQCVPAPGKGQAAVLMLRSRKPNSAALQPGRGLILGTRKQRTWDKAAMN